MYSILDDSNAFIRRISRKHFFSILLAYKETILHLFNSLFKLDIYIIVTT